MVDQRVAWTRVERKHRLPLCARRHPGDIGDAADVLHGAAQLVVAEKQRVTPRRERRALTPSGNVARAEICHCRDAQAFGNDRWLTQLQG